MCRLLHLGVLASLVREGKNGLLGSYVHIYYFEIQLLCYHFVTFWLTKQGSRPVTGVHNHSMDSTWQVYKYKCIHTYNKPFPNFQKVTKWPKVDLIVTATYRGNTSCKTHQLTVPYDSSISGKCTANKFFVDSSVTFGYDYLFLKQKYVPTLSKP